MSGQGCAAGGAGRNVNTRRARGKPVVRPAARKNEARGDATRAGGVPALARVMRWIRNQCFVVSGAAGDGVIGGAAGGGVAAFSTSLFVTTNSMRRFFAMLSGVVFGTIGFASP